MPEKTQGGNIQLMQFNFPSQGISALFCFTPSTPSSKCVPDDSLVKSVKMSPVLFQDIHISLGPGHSNVSVEEIVLSPGLDLNPQISTGLPTETSKFSCVLFFDIRCCALWSHKVSSYFYHILLIIQVLQCWKTDLPKYTLNQMFTIPFRLSN